jgi:heterodisulfide reductase subunit B2
MPTPYFPGCTLATKARNFDVSARAAADALGLPLAELPNWQCCGATFPLATDNAMALIAPARILAQAEQQGDRLATVCAMCYNVLKRTEVALRRHPEQLERINWFIAGDPVGGGYTYQGRLRVTHLLEMLRDDLGWQALAARATGAANRVAGLKLAPYYGCLLLRPPSEIGLDDPDAATILGDLLTALGAQPVPFAFQNECCGSYLVVSRPELPEALSGRILEQAAAAGASAIVTACPLCQYNLDRHAAAFRPHGRLPVLYFTQLLAIALDLPPTTWGFDWHRVDPAPLFA